MVRMFGWCWSGKTIVALISMLNAILDGFKVLMVPTEILAIQHFNTIKDLLMPLKLNQPFIRESRSVYDNKLDLI